MHIWYSVQVKLGEIQSSLRVEIARKYAERCWDFYTDIFNGEEFKAGK